MHLIPAWTAIFTVSCCSCCSQANSIGWRQIQES